MVFKRGDTPWNKGLTKETDPRVARYVKTHVGKPSGALGKTWKWSDESRARLSKRVMGRPSWNKGFTKETDLRLAKSADTLSKRINSDPRLLKIRSENGRANKGRKAWNKGLTKETDPRVAKYANKLTGKPKTASAREAYSRSKLRQSPEERSRISRIAGLASAAKLTPKERSQRGLNAFLKMRKNNTSIELKLQEQLDSRNIQYKTQEKLLGITAADIFIQPDICIFADGDYWHTRPGKQEKDDEINKTLIENGYKVLRFWGSEIRDDLDKCILKILDTIKK